MVWRYREYTHTRYNTPQTKLFYIYGAGQGPFLHERLGMLHQVRFARSPSLAAEPPQAKCSFHMRDHRHGTEEQGQVDDGVEPVRVQPVLSKIFCVHVVQRIVQRRNCKTFVLQRVGEDECGSAQQTTKPTVRQDTQSSLNAERHHTRAVMAATATNDAAAAAVVALTSL